jgi:hypothetical protein
LDNLDEPEAVTFHPDAALMPIACLKPGAVDNADEPIFHEQGLTGLGT